LNEFASVDSMDFECGDSNVFGDYHWPLRLQFADNFLSFRFNCGRRFGLLERFEKL
jgi:hypothetical protein